MDSWSGAQRQNTHHEKPKQNGSREMYSHLYHDTQGTIKHTSAFDAESNSSGVRRQIVNNKRRRK